MDDRLRPARPSAEDMVLQEQAGLVASLREHGLGPQAAELATLYAAQQKSLLCADVYEAAKGQGDPPTAGHGAVPTRKPCVQPVLSFPMMNSKNC